MSATETVLELQEITKSFPGVLANDHVSISISRGEIHALVGENGAGKSTLMKIAAGIYRPDEGRILVDGEPQNIRRPMDAFKVGISAVHQDFMLVDSLTVLENIVLGYEPKRPLGFLDTRKAVEELGALSSKYGMNVPLNAKTGALPVAIRQQVEILKALYKNTKILILDEPTAVLTPQETEDLFKALKSLKDMGTTIVFVSHKLNEVMSLADRVTVMRAGTIQGTMPVSEASEEDLARMMVGRDVIFRVKRRKKEIGSGEPVMESKGIGCLNSDGRRVLQDINLRVMPSEILGLAGVAGNGQTELVEILTGFLQPEEGHICIEGQDFSLISTHQFRRNSSYVCQDRRQVGSSPNQSIWENVIIGLQDQSRFSNKLGFLRKPPIREYAKGIVEQFDVRTPSVDASCGTLSGGNLQKVILGRELTKDPTLLIAEDPTRGLDVGATEYVRNRILDFAAKGKGVFLVSQDLNELLMLSDRIAIIYAGEIVGEVDVSEATPELVGMYMLGLKRDQKAGEKMLR